MTCQLSNICLVFQNAFDDSYYEGADEEKPQFDDDLDDVEGKLLYFASSICSHYFDHLRIRMTTDTFV